MQRTDSAIVFGHADADGHIAAEQSRGNLEKEGIVVQDLVVSDETRNYRFWEETFTRIDFGNYDLVVTVDIAFNFTDPARSLEALLSRVDRHPNTNFTVIDHHALLSPAMPRANLNLVEVSSPYDCCYGSPDEELMVIAAICDGDEKRVRPVMSEQHKQRAIGVRRAAADVNGIAGNRLLALLRHREWEFFEALAKEPAAYHKAIRGRRLAMGLQSPLLRAAAV